MKKYLKKGKNIEKNKLKHIFKSILFYTKLVFYVSIGILSLGMIFVLFMGSDLEEEIFEDEYELMRRREQLEDDLISEKTKKYNKLTLIKKEENNEREI